MKNENKHEPSSNEFNKSDPDQVNIICKLPDSKGVLVAHKNCNQFYKCMKGRPFVINCAKNLLYNTVTESCDLPQNVKCGRRSREVDEKQTILTTTHKSIGVPYSIEDIDLSNADPSQAIAQCSAKRSDGVLVAHEYCNMFYKCFGGVPITMKCPNSLLYNPIKELCDRPAIVDCNDRTLPNTDDSNADTDNENNELTVDDYESAAIDTCAAEFSDGILSVHERCNHFYKCSGGKPVAFSCPGDLLFDSKKKYCAWPNNVECGERTEYDPINDEHKSDDPKQAHDICAAEDSDGVLVAHQSCNKFYKCHDALPVVVQCPGILLYNINEEICDWPTHVNCKDRIVPENLRTLKEADENHDDNGSQKVNRKALFIRSGFHKDIDDHEKLNLVKDVSGYNYHIDFSNVAETCADDSFDGKLLPHENCNQFYKCSEGIATAFFCPLNLFYNIQNMNCDWRNNVNCGNRIAPKIENNDVEDHNRSQTQCRGKADGTIVAHENCSQFYKCINGQKYAMDCPLGLYFNAMLIVCDWPMNVDCGDRLTEAQLKSEPGV